MPLPKLTFGVIIFCSLAVNALAQSTFYAASKSGLNLRQDANASSTIVAKIPYGAKVTKAADSHYGELVTEGMNAQWVRVLYDGRPGYVANVYLLPFAPPNATDVQKWGSYLNNLSPQMCTGEKIMSHKEEDNQIQVERTLYKNGIAYRRYVGHEYDAETLWIPNISMEQAFVLARLLSPEAGLLSTSDVYPSKSSEGNSPNSHSVRLIKPYPGNDWVSTIHYEWCDGGCYNLEIRYEEGEIAITLSNGV